MNDKRLLYPTGFLRISWQSIACRVVLFCLVILMPGALWADTYYVDATGGSDANNGTPNEVDAWQTLAKVSGSTFGAGDTILFKRGEVWNESLTIPSSGAAGNPIIFGAYGTGDPPLFDGATSSLTWSPFSGSVYSAPLAGDPGLLIYKGTPKPAIATLDFTSSVDAVKPGAILLQLASGAYSNFWVTSVDKTAKKISGITFFHTSGKHWQAGTPVQVRQLDSTGREITLSSTLDLAISNLQVDPNSLQQPGHWYWESGVLYLYSDTDPDLITVEVGQKTNGISINNQQYIIIQDLAIRGFQDEGVRISNSKYITVRRLQVSEIGMGGAHAGIFLINSGNCAVDDNRVESVLVNGIVMYYCSYDYCGPADYSSSNTISDNTVLDSGSTGIGLWTDGPDQANGIQGNTVSGNSVQQAHTLSYDGGAIYALFTGTGNRISGNTLGNCGTIELSCSGIVLDLGVQATTVTSNTALNNSMGGITITGSGHQITDNILLNNGLRSWNNAQIIFFPVEENVTNCSVQGNTVEAGSGQYLFQKYINPNWPDQGNIINNNTYRSRAASTFCWSNNWTNDDWVDFKTWKSRSNQDADSTFSFITDPPPPDIKSINSTYLLLLK